MKTRSLLTITLCMMMLAACAVKPTEQAVADSADNSSLATTANTDNVGGDDDKNSGLTDSSSGEASGADQEKSL